MGQQDIINILKLERKCGNDTFLSALEIQVALKNIGIQIRKENILKNIKHIRCSGMVEQQERSMNNKKYRLKEEYVYM